MCQWKYEYRFTAKTSLECKMTVKSENFNFIFQLTVTTHHSVQWSAFIEASNGDQELSQAQNYNLSF